MTGSVVVDAAGDPQTAPAPEELLVRLDPEALAVSGGPTIVASATASSPVSGSVAPDGTFTIRGVIPGRYRATVLTKAPRKEWRLESAVVNGRDTLDHGLEIDAQDVSAVLTFTNRYTQLTGTLQTPAGQPAPDYVVIAFPADRTLWRPSARRIQTSRLDTPDAAVDGPANEPSRSPRARRAVDTDPAVWAKWAP